MLQQNRVLVILKQYCLNVFCRDEKVEKDKTKIMSSMNNVKFRG